MPARATATAGVSETEASELYRRDPFTWAQRQAAAMRRRNYDAIDWENVIEEIEDVARAEERQWTRNCARAIENLLTVEHDPTPTASTLAHWRMEIRNFRREMADAIKDNPGLQRRYDEMLAKAWKRGRALARDQLTEYSMAAVAGGEISEKAQYRLWNRKLPAENPYELADVTAFDPRRDREPSSDLWPASVARVLNTQLGTDYPIRCAHARGRAEGWSR